MKLQNKKKINKVKLKIDKQNEFKSNQNKNKEQLKEIKSKK